MALIDEFFAVTQAALTALITGERAAIAAAGEAVAEVVARGGIVYLFGTGHSHLLAEEGYYRAGGLACMAAILPEAFQLHRDAVGSTARERDVRYAEGIFDTYDLRAGDGIIVFSHSGANAVPVEVARRARAMGLTVIGVACRAALAAAAGRHDGATLPDVVDVLIDNHGCIGDACLAVGDPGMKARSPGSPGAAIAPLSTILGAWVLHAITAEAVERLLARGIAPPVYLSSKLPEADAHNAALVERYAPRIPHLRGSEGR